MSVQLRDGSTVDDRRLDRLPTGHTRHLERFPLTMSTMPAENMSMVMGVNWYSNFDEPKLRRIRGRNYYVIGDGPLGRLRGGHATCLRNWNVRDASSWYRYYDQGVEGRCVEFACLRMLSLSNRIRYDLTSRWHYWMMQRLDYWPGGSYPGAEPHYEGTSVDAGMQVLHKFGAIRARSKDEPIDLDLAPSLVRPEDGIASYRWAQTWADVRTVLNVPDWSPGVPMLNSWGQSWPRQVLLLDSAGERLLNEDGEFAVPTDR